MYCTLWSAHYDAPCTMVPRSLVDGDGVPLHERGTPVGSAELATLTWPVYSFVIEAFGVQVS